METIEFITVNRHDSKNFFLELDHSGALWSLTRCPCLLKYCFLLNLLSDQEIGHWKKASLWGVMWCTPHNWYTTRLRHENVVLGAFVTMGGLYEQLPPGQCIFVFPTSSITILMLFLFRGEYQNHSVDIGENSFPYNIWNSYTFGKGMDIIYYRC